MTAAAPAGDRGRPRRLAGPLSVSESRKFRVLPKPNHLGAALTFSDVGYRNRQLGIRRLPGGVPLAFTLDSIDRRIVSLLIEDGRISSAEITRRIGHVSERAVRYRIDRLVRNGVIRVSAIVMPQAVGFPIIGDVLVDVAPGKLQDVAAQLVDFPTVSYVAGSVGEGDLSVQVYARDTEELLRFVNEVIGKVAGVTRTKLAMVPWKLKDVYQWQVPVDAAEEGRTIV